MKDIFQFIKENETRNEDDVTQEEFLEALLEIEEELDAFELEESVELDEATDFKSTFDDLKKGDTVKIKYGSSISKQQEGTFKVTFKSIVGKSKVGKITLVKQGEGAAKVKHYLYDRDGKVSMAMGDMGANMTRLVKESLDEKAPKMKGDWLKQERERNNKHDAAMGRTKTGRKKPTRTMTSTQKSLASMRGESVELNELSAEEKKLINTMYDKKGNLTPMGKKVMDHGKKNAVKESVELDEASEEGKIRVIDLSDAHPNNRMGAKEKSGYQVQRMTKGKFVNQGKPYKKYADAKKVQQGTGQHSMQFEEISGTGYELYHKDFSGAMKHAYTHAKKKFGITVDSDEIDDKVAMGPRKPGNGKTNTYRLKGDKGNIQVQVYNRGGSKPFELNMYKESVELDESKWEYQDARGVTKTGSLSKTVERQGTDVSYIFKGDDGKTDVVSGSRLKKMKKIKESVIDEAVGALGMESAAKALEKYAKAFGGPDEKDFMIAARLLRKGLDMKLKKFVNDMDTEPREKVITTMAKTMGKKPVERMFSVRLREIDEAKTPELKGNPFKYYKKPANKKEAQSNVNFWHYVGMADNDEIEDMGKIPANYKSYAKSMKQDAQRELKKMNEAVEMVCEDCGCEPNQPQEGCECPNDNSDLNGDHWVVKGEDGMNESYVPEKLGVGDGMKAWIADFKKSDAPQFKGASVNKRRKMAYAAYMDAKRG